MKTLLAAAAIVLLATTAHAGSIPKEFHGHWCITPDTAASTNQLYERKDCRDNDGTLTVSAKGTLARESGCDLVSGKLRAMGGRTGYRARYKCEGEGMKWNAISDMVIIDGERRHLIINLIKMSNEKSL